MVLLRAQVSEGEGVLALVATPGRLYVFLGGPGLQGAFSGYSSRSLGASNLPRQCGGEHYRNRESSMNNDLATLVAASLLHAL